jgi:quinol monooxygenase YgiN
MTNNMSHAIADPSLLRWCGRVLGTSLLIPISPSKENLMSTPYAFVARIEAKPETAEDVASLLTGALSLAEAEKGTVRWHAARTSPTTFWVFDTFVDEDARQAHLNGPIAAALMANIDALAAAPEIMPADVLAVK